MTTQPQPKPPGILARVGAAARLLVDGKVNNTIWFGPNEPLLPVAPPEVAGRRFDYMPGRNLNVRPRGEGDERIDFHQLRALADRCDVLRLVIETRKDQLSKLQFAIQPRDKTAKAANDPRCAEIEVFLRSPDQENSWDSWVRQLAEDMFVLDAATIYPRMNKGGGLYGLELVDGATIKPVIDDHGRRPVPPLPAYQQVLHGLAAVDYSADQLFYLPRNRRTNKVYGYGPVEQIVMTVNMALRRQMHQLEFYTQGTVPDAMVGVPDSWSPDQIEQFQQYWDGLLADNTAQRRHVRFLPGDLAKNFVQTKDAILKDDFDEWLARIVSYAFSVSPQWAVKQMNRATSDTAQEVSLEEGLAPFKMWLKNAIDVILAKVFGAPDLELAWVSEDEVDPTSQEALLQLRQKSGVYTINEYKAAIGEEPIGPDGDVRLLFTAGAVVTLDSILRPPPPPPQLAPGMGHNGGPPLDDDRQADGQASNGRKPPVKTGSTPDQPVVDNKNKQDMTKAAGAPRHLGPPDLNRPAAVKARRALEILFRALFKQEAKSVAAKSRTMIKADDGNDDGDGSGIAPLDPDAWATAQADVSDALVALARDGAAQGSAAVGVSTDLPNSRAADWAQNHAGSLIKDLQGTTLDALRGLVAKSETEGWSVDQLADAIESDSTFGTARAQLIAQMETRAADYQGNLIAWKSAAEQGIDVRKQWICRGDNVCAECQSNEADGPIAVDDSFSGGDDVPPAHVNCECDVEPVLSGDDATDSEDQS